MPKHKILFFLFLAILFIASCKKKTNYEVDVSSVTSSAKIIAFNNTFYNKSKSLATIKKQYPILFDDTEDSVWEARRIDTLELSIQKNVIATHGNYGELETKLQDFFKHIKYYYPRFKEPTIYLYSSKLEDFSEPIIYINDQRGNFLFISIDCFLGEKNKYYTSFPSYISKRMNPDNLFALLSEKIAEEIIPKSTSNINFLASILYQGKKMILADAFLPKIANHLKIGYTQKEIEWCKENEKNIWRFFVDGNYFYNPDPKLNQRFIDLSPFSKFYTEIDAESPGSIGTWLGWEIAKSYLQNNKTTVQEFISITDENLILKNSGYNP